MKKIVSVILAGMIVLGVAACSGKKETEKTTAATTAATTTEATTEETTTSESTTEATTEETTETTTEATTETTTEATTETSSEETAESTTEATTVDASEPKFEGVYKIEVSWTGFDGGYPEFSIVEENDEGAFGEIVTISKEEEEGTGSAEMYIPTLQGKSYILKIDTFNPNDGCNYPFATAKVTVKDRDGKEVGTVELDKFLIIKGPAGPWAYHVCSISEDGVKTLEA